MRRHLAQLLVATLVMSLSTITLATPAYAATRTFQINCTFDGVSPHRALDDPIVNPGDSAAHMHDFFGNRSTNRHSTYADMTAAGTRCALAADTAAYWVPTLIDRGGVSVPPIFANVYYRSANNDATVTAFPPDFRVVAGFPDPNPSLKNMFWSCTNSTRRLAAPGPCGKASLRATVNFPSCGQLDALGAVVPDSPSHRAHATYPTAGVCPSTHPVLLPRLTLEVRWKVRDGTGYRLSAGGPETMHADFWNTWQQSALESLVNGCLNDGIGCGKQAG